MTGIFSREYRERHLTIGLIILGILVGAWLASTFRILTSQPEPAVIAGSPINFGETGYIVDREENKFNDGLYLVYEKPGAPALSVKLIFNEQSTCTLGLNAKIICVALSVTIDTATQGKRAAVTGYRTGDTVVVQTIEIVPEVKEQFGYITSVSRNGQNALVVIDEVEFLSGDKAIQAAMKDTGCSRDQVENCAPSLYNDFYISNSGQQSVTYNLLPDSDIEILKSPGGPELVKADLTTFLEEARDPWSLIVNSSPFMYRLEGATLIKLQQQYLP